MAAFALFNSYKVANSLARPTWQVRTVSNQLNRILPRGATVAGDWIPLFAIGTNLPVLYTNRVFNRPARFWELRPSHFLYCDTRGGKIVKGIIEKFDWLKLGPQLWTDNANNETGFTLERADAGVGQGGQGRVALN